MKRQSYTKPTCANRKEEEAGVVSRIIQQSLSLGKEYVS